MKMLAALVLLMASPASAQTVDDLVARNIEARGGLAKLKALESVRIERTVAAVFTNIEVVIYKKRPNLYRSEQKPREAAAPTVRGFSDTAWESAGGKTTVREGAAPAEQREIDADFDGFLVDYREKGHAIALEGKQKLGPTEVYKLKVTMKSGAERVVYLDAATFLERRHEGTIELGPNRRVKTTIDYGDWRDVGGVKFPFAIEEDRDAPGQTFVHYTKRIEVNVPMDDALFRMPS
jgi:hypothetical protein